MFRYKRFLSGMFIFSILAMPMTAQAETLQEKLHKYQNQYSQLQGQYADQKKQESSAANRLQGIQGSMDALNAEIAAQTNAIEKQRQEIEALDKKQRELNAKKLEMQNQIGGFIRANYENGTSSYLEVILEAKSLSDLLYRVETVKYIFDRYKQVQADLDKVTEDIKQQSALAEQHKADLQAALEQKRVTQGNLDQAGDKQRALLASLTAQEKLTLSRKSQAQRNIDYIQELIRQEQIDAENARKKPVASGGSGISGPVKMRGTVAELISYAESFIGTPYVWGGTTPNPGFDCSGYVQYVYRHFGVNLARVSQDQYREGIPVSTANLKPGDLVFFHTYDDGRGPSSPTHEGIYIGNGQMVDSESRGVLVTSIFTNRYWSPRYLGARRVLAN